MGPPRVHVLAIGDGEDGPARLADGVQLSAALADAPDLLVTSAPTLRQGLALLDENPVHVVLLDLDLPDGAGVDVLDTLIRAAPRAAVVVLADPDDTTPAVHAVHSGAQDCLVKGCFDRDGLVRSLRYALELKRAEHEWRGAEERWRQLAEHATDVIYRLRLSPEVRFDYVNPAVEALTGIAAEEFQRDAGLAEAIVHPGDRDAWRGFLLEPHAVPVPFRLRWRTRGGGLVWTEHRVTPVLDEQGNLVSVDGVARDVTLARRYEEALAPVALHDRLTGLPNPLLLLDRLRVAMSRLRRSKGAVAVFHLDLDGFKDVNDMLGHRRGDDLLAVVAERILSGLRPGDTAARLGGDEFVAVCELGSEREALSVADRLRAALARPVALGDCRIVVSASVGVAVTRRCLPDVEELLHRAHVATHTAKRHGGAGPALVPAQPSRSGPAKAGRA